MELQKFVTQEIHDRIMDKCDERELELDDLLERLDKLSLKMFSVDVKTTDYVPNAEYINVKVDATVKIRIGQTEEMMSLASKFFLNEGEQMIISRVKDTLEEMVTDRKAFGERVQENAIPDLQKMGLEMISFNVQSFSD